MKIMHFVGDWKNRTHAGHVIYINLLICFVKYWNDLVYVIIGGFQLDTVFFFSVSHFLSAQYTYDWYSVLHKY
jgi:hypothetical protein